MDNKDLGFLGMMRPYGITGSASGDLLVCLCEDDQSKVVRYSSTGTVLQEIQYDWQGQPLYQNACYISENVNEEIIVTDSRKKVLVAVDSWIVDRMFLYTCPQRNYDLDDVSSVTTDSEGHVS